jgi:pimeloyl-ACP methyl ester carboxylesterase
VSEFPIFVPHDGGHLAAWVTLPEIGPRGLVLMLPGASLDEEIGSYLLFPRAAARLAELGFASVRMDYFGLGESTQDTETWPVGLIEPALEQSKTVLATTRRAVPVESFGVLALCYGGRVALRLTAQPDCVGALCVAPPLIEQGRWTRARHKYGHSTLISHIKSNKRLRRVILRPLRRAFAEKKATPLVKDALRSLGQGRILVLYGEGEVRRDHSRLQATKRLQSIGATASEDGQGRLAVEVMPTEPLAGFDLMSPADQELILDRVVSWLTESFAARERAARTARRQHAASKEPAR